MSLPKIAKEAKFLTELEKLRDGLEELLEDEEFAEAFEDDEEEYLEENLSLPIPLKRLPSSEGLDLPAYATEGSVGMDLCAALDQPQTLRPGARAALPTGFAIAVPPGFEAQVRSRSGLALKQGLVVLNSPGTIDQDYRGEIQVILINHGAESVTITRGMRIAQLVITPILHAAWQISETLPASIRNEGGFGSTGV